MLVRRRCRQEMILFGRNWHHQISKVFRHKMSLFGVRGSFHSENFNQKSLEIVHLEFYSELCNVMTHPHTRNIEKICFPLCSYNKLYLREDFTTACRRRRFVEVFAIKFYAIQAPCSCVSESAQQISNITEYLPRKKVQIWSSPVTSRFKFFFLKMSIATLFLSFCLSHCRCLQLFYSFMFIKKNGRRKSY